MKKFILKNRQFISEDQAAISIKERAFLFGDGAFETCKIFNGKIYNFNSHKNRLQKTLKTLKIKAQIEDLKEQAQELIGKNNSKNGILRISVSRGIGSSGYLPTNESEALIVIETQEERIVSGKISLGISKYKAPSAPIGKSLNAIPYILNKISAGEQNLFDLVMFSSERFIAETSSANIFWVKNNKIYTADKSCSIVEGTVRARLLKISPYKINSVKKGINALKTADEIFLTNSSFLILPVDDFLGRKLQKTWSEKLMIILKNDLLKSC